MNQDNIDLEDSTNKLTSAIENLPAILERKRRVDAHTSVATNLLDQIKLRGLDALFRAEDKILHGGKPERAVIDMLKDETIGNMDGTDKLRLLLVYLLGKPTNVNVFTNVFTVYLHKNKVHFYLGHSKF